MKYIEKNFDKEYIIHNNEIECLNTFLSEIKDNKAVECICLLPTYVNGDMGSDYCAINVDIFAQKELEDFNKLERSIDKVTSNLHKRYLPINQYQFDAIDINRFASNRKENELFKTLCEKDIVSSYIIFDRHHLFGKLQEKLKSKLHPWTSLAKLQNIEKLEDKKKPKVLIKK